MYSPQPHTCNPTPTSHHAAPLNTYPHLLASSYTPQLERIEGPPEPSTSRGGRGDKKGKAGKGGSEDAMDMEGSQPVLLAQVSVGMFYCGCVWETTSRLVCMKARALTCV